MAMGRALVTTLFTMSILWLEVSAWAQRFPGVANYV
jgi:hypothetical protein